MNITPEEAKSSSKFVGPGTLKYTVPWSEEPQEEYGWLFVDDNVAVVVSEDRTVSINRDRFVLAKIDSEDI